NSQRVCQPVEVVRYGETGRATSLKLYSCRYIVLPRFVSSAAASFEVIHAGCKIQVMNRVVSEYGFPGKVPGVLLHVAAANEPDLRIEIALHFVVFANDDPFVGSPSR